MIIDEGDAFIKEDGGYPAAYVFLITKTSSTRIEHMYRSSMPNAMWVKNCTVHIGDFNTWVEQGHIKVMSQFEKELYL